MTEDLGIAMEEEYNSIRASLDVNIPEMTGKILKTCNVIRSKQHGSKVLRKHTGVAAGARSGSQSVHQPILDLRKMRARSSEQHFRNVHESFKELFGSTDTTAADSMLQGDFHDYFPSKKLHIRKHMKEIKNV